VQRSKGAKKRFNAEAQRGRGAEKRETEDSFNAKAQRGKGAKGREKI
jgi:hypothetical protein